MVWYYADFHTLYWPTVNCIWKRTFEEKLHELYWCLSVTCWLRISGWKFWCHSQDIVNHDKIPRKSTNVSMLIIIVTSKNYDILCLKFGVVFRFSSVLHNYKKKLFYFLVYFFTLFNSLLSVGACKRVWVRVCVWAASLLMNSWLAAITGGEFSYQLQLHGLQYTDSQIPGDFWEYFRLISQILAWQAWNNFSLSLCATVTSVSHAGMSQIECCSSEVLLPLNELTLCQDKTRQDTRQYRASS